MRIWDIPCTKLKCQWLLAEHRELHGIWSILQGNKRGYSRHPETLRWQGKLKVLKARHRKQVKEMITRGYRHRTPLRGRATGKEIQDMLLLSIKAQRVLLRQKGGLIQ